MMALRASQCDFRIYGKNSSVDVHYCLILLN